MTLALFRGDQVVGGELFELEDLDAARVRFEELRRRATGSRRLQRAARVVRIFSAR